MRIERLADLYHYGHDPSQAAAATVFTGSADHEKQHYSSGTLAFERIFGASPTSIGHDAKHVSLPGSTSV